MLSNPSNIFIKIILLCAPAISVAQSNQITKQNSITELNTRIDKFLSAYINDFDTLEFAKDFRETSRLSGAEPIIERRVLMKKKAAIIKNDGKRYFQRIQLSAQEYSDSNQCNNAVEKWLRTFTTDGGAVKIGENFKSIFSPPVFMIMTSRQLIVMEIGCVYIDANWELMKNNLVNAIVDQGAYHKTLDCGCGGPLKWN